MAAARRPEAPPVFAVETLLSRGGEAVLLHANERYRLRITAKGKLILTK